MTLTPSASPGHTDAWPMCQTASPASSSVAVGERCSPLVDVAPGAVAPFYPSPSPPPRGSRACASPSTSAPPDLIASESTESYRMSSEDCDSTQGADVACQSSKRSMSAYKGHKVCAYELCPSPMHSKKWRIVTEGTSAGGRDWDALVGKTLCDSCYSTFRKHGTFVRSIRTNDGWSRSVQAGTIGVKRPALASGPLHEAKSKPSPKPTMSRSQPSPKRPRTQSAAPKLPAVASAATSGTSNGALPKRKAAMKAAGSWRVAGGDKGGAVDRQVEAELLDAVAILRSMQRSSYAGGVAESVAASGREQSRSPAPLQTGARRASQDHLSASPDATAADDGAAAAAHVKPAAAGDAGCLRDGSPAPPCLVPLRSRSPAETPAVREQARAGQPWQRSDRSEGLEGSVTPLTTRRLEAEETEVHAGEAQGASSLAALRACVHMQQEAACGAGMFWRQLSAMERSDHLAR